MEYLAIIVFVISTCVTPGPNNALIMASGLNYGVRRSLRHFFGICIGFPAMIVAVGLGIAGLFEQVPVLHVILKLVGAAYLTYLAWRIASAPISEINETKGKPFTFLQAAAFQWVNPKAWVLAVGATVTYTVISDSYVIQVLTIALLFMLFGAPCTMLWLWFGASLKTILQKPSYVRIFNVSMATLLMGSLIPIFIELYQQFAV
ncbi:MAG: LysE family translocator [Pseudomonadales bacterium]|nr:LysE family translocator [Pseudomonadales bacterium]